MLLEFSVSNWMSFRDEVKFSMLATRERQHGERIVKLNKECGQLKVLPIAVLYGGNASGKSNLLMAALFAKEFVVHGSRRGEFTGVQPFALRENREELPTVFRFVILVSEKIYRFEFELTRERVVRERLVLMTGECETVQYNRHDNALDELQKDLENPEFLRFAFQGTRENQLFLTNSVMQNAKAFLDVFKWFGEYLEVISPNAQFVPVEEYFRENSVLRTGMELTLQQLDTGIKRLEGLPSALKDLPIPELEKEKLEKTIQEGEAVRIRHGREIFVVTRDAGLLKVVRMTAIHRGALEKEYSFEMSKESDGTLRLMELLPAFFALGAAKSKKVYLFDELDRSLHPKLTRHLIETYLLGTNHETRSQVIFTTHDIQLMDQELFRRDELWATERGGDGVSVLIPFSDFKDIRYDKDIRRSYLQGRMGGIPRLSARTVFDADFSLDAL